MNLSIGDDKTMVILFYFLNMKLNFYLLSRILAKQGFLNPKYKRV